MFQFCFNDCIPKDGANGTLVNHLTVSLTHYDKIKRYFPEVVDGIITDRLPQNIVLNEANFSLQNCIQYLDRELKKIAFSSFCKFPVEEYYNQFDIDSLLANEYTILIDKVAHDATNAKIVQENGGMLFTLPVHNELKKNKLVISNNANETCEANNQYGADANTAFIKELIQADLVRRAQGFDKLLALVGDCKHDDRFRREFDRLTSATQDFLLKEIDFAIKRKAQTRFSPDDKLIKDVTPAKERNISVFELRIYSPVAIRMYFYETSERIYFGSICNKPKKKVQDNDILNAASVINELVMLGG